MGSFKPVTVGLSILVIAAIVVGLVIGVHNARHNVRSRGNDLSSMSKSVNAFCSPTDYKKTCALSLKSLSTNDSATPKDYLKLAINATIDSFEVGIDKVEAIGKDATSHKEKDAFEDCRSLLEYSVHALEKVFTSVENATLQDMKEKAPVELNNWLSATLSYQQVCLDIIENGTLKDQLINEGLQNSTELSSNILTMVSEFSEILESIGVKILGGRKRLLGMDESGFPWWVKEVDRRLLMVKDVVGSLAFPNAVVAQDGSGQFKTINSATNAYPNEFNGRYVIFVKAGIYNEQVSIPEHMQNVFMYGEGPGKSIVTGSLSNGQGTNTFRSATFGVIGDGFICKSMGIRNTAGPTGYQAVALRVQADKSVFYNCRIDGFQDTLYVVAQRQFYRNCVISGTVDFIFGDGSVIIQNSLIIVRLPMDGQENTVTSQAKSFRHEHTGIVIQKCRIVPDQDLYPERFKIQTFLGRPWKQYSTTVIMESTLPDFIQPAGWMAWAGDFALDTLFYAEYANNGPGSNVSQRVNWKGFQVMTDASEAMWWTIGPFLHGQGWIFESGVPFLLGLN